MNAVLRIFVWLLALSVVTLPVVAVLNGWVGAERWPLAQTTISGRCLNFSSSPSRCATSPAGM